MKKQFPLNISHVLQDFSTLTVLNPSTSERLQPQLLNHDLLFDPNRHEPHPTHVNPSTEPMTQNDS